MKILFDQGTPVPLRQALQGHVIETAYEKGWQTLKNGELLAIAEDEKYDIILTTDQNLRYQQDLRGRGIAVIVLLSTSWPRIQKHAATIVEITERARPGEYHEIPVS